MQKFRVGISGSIFGSDGAPCFDPQILQKLMDRPDVDATILPAEKTEIDAHDAENFNAIYLMLEKVSFSQIAPRTGPFTGRLRLLARHGVGFDSVDIDGMNNLGIMVTNTPDAVRRPVATMAMTMMLAVTHRIIEKHNLTRAGGWSHNADYMGTGLTGKVLGVLGAGSIGKEILRLAQPFEMKLAAADPNCSVAELSALGAEKLSTEELFEKSDVLIIATSLNQDTYHLVDMSKLSRMKRTAALINVARGPVIKEVDLIEALQKNYLSCAGLDVFEQEPVDMANPLLKMDNVITTSHSLCWTDECFDNIARDAIGSVLSYADRRTPQYIVNRSVLEHPRQQSWF